MADAMLSELKALDVPFFSISRNLVVADEIAMHHTYVVTFGADVLLVFFTLTSTQLHQTSKVAYHHLTKAKYCTNVFLPHFI